MFREVEGRSGDARGRLLPSLLALAVGLTLVGWWLSSSIGKWMFDYPKAWQLPAARHISGWHFYSEITTSYHNSICHINYFFDIIHRIVALNFGNDTNWLTIFFFDFQIFFIFLNEKT